MPLHGAESSVVDEQLNLVRRTRVGVVEIPAGEQVQRRELDVNDDVVAVTEADFRCRLSHVVSPEAGTGNEVGNISASTSLRTSRSGNP